MKSYNDIENYLISRLAHAETKLQSYDNMNLFQLILWRLGFGVTVYGRNYNHIHNNIRRRLEFMSRGQQIDDDDAAREQVEPKDEPDGCKWKRNIFP